MSDAKLYATISVLSLLILLVGTLFLIMPSGPDMITGSYAITGDEVYPEPQFPNENASNKITGVYQVWT